MNLKNFTLQPGILVCLIFHLIVLPLVSLVTLFSLDVAIISMLLLPTNYEALREKFVNFANSLPYSSINPPPAVDNTFLPKPKEGVLPYRKWKHARQRTKKYVN
jgi:hypothetical protein